ncbi:C4-dicarboxylate ABC transporter substrate-binding protein [Desulfuribacillus stibiiarsenatis]|uniref:C4-dicarboxylate ABC transporter substrate-binding protein n=1 Tax=Desulfuribacillus stibiiarsenatis TaxID=1390249 RepID=A0A1E5L5S0_9FIRM|nr:TAXI family TRAP transporter solute-binding subunit [Desulfuribacillus stibiiarsenatis]OEH85378.1 C4-dicarboxylate ABC transporter substrate-binding protein [Desulfuribacillus stibiiarsenatis]
MFRSKKFTILITVLLVLSLAIVGCGGSKDAAPAPTPAPDQKDATPAGPDKSKWPKNLQLGAASIGGAYYVYAGGISTVLQEKVGIEVGVEVTDGPNHNIQLLEIGDMDLGLVTMGPAWEAWHGEEAWTGGKKHQNMRAIFPMYNTYSQWWASASTGIKSVQDLAGKKVGAGPKSGTAGTFHPRFLEIAGVNANLQFAGLSDLVSSHLDKQLDANSFASGIPVAGVMETASQMKDIVMFGVDGELRDEVVKKYPFWTPAQIPVSAYPDFLKAPVETVAIGNWAVAHKDLPEDLVYEIVKAIMENNDMMLQAHQAAAETKPEFAKDNTWLPMHPGAIKYFEEVGIELHPDVKK